MHTQVSTRVAEPTEFVSPLHREEMQRDRLARDVRNAAAPIKNTDRAVSVLTGRESAAPMFAVGLLAEEQGLSYNFMTAELKGLLRVALYLSDCKVAELRAAEDPETITALAAATVERCGIDFLKTLANQDPEDRDVFPKTGRMLAAVDAAYRWQWEALLPRK
ncbi:hypothetical protein [Glycomyces buryatensis]|uniref:Uncharacterized protein n=1 Tax=Glycomyces buryatensis TaxID=2570927 RepID=A0A4S8Q9Y8_9ACTN|nr:hypothetical protein [Glycomyces buryatensis]THV41257.1 hypothetical protein FAB82_12600 [Glycomyces buryatensis]